MATASNDYLVIYGASNVTGTKTNPVITLSGSIEDLEIQGSEDGRPFDYSTIKATVNGQPYTITSEGKLDTSIPNFGLMSKADKIKLSSIDPDNYAPKASPAFTGTPTAPTAAANNSTTQIATTAYVDRAVANIDIPESGVTGVKGSAEASYRTGNVEITKANVGLGNVDNTADSTKSVASAGKLTTAVDIKIASSDNSNPGSAVSFDGSGSKTLLLPSTIKADLTGTATAATKDGSGNTITAHYAPIASPALTGSPTAPTQSENDSSTKLATTAYTDRAVQKVSGNPPEGFETLKKISDIIGNLGNIDGTITEAIANKQDASDALSSIADAGEIVGAIVYTKAPGTFVSSKITTEGRELISKGTVAEMRTYLGAVDSTATVAAATKDGADHTISTYFAPVSSPALTGSPTAPTQSKNDSSTKLATTAYVDRAVSDLINGAPAALDTLKEISDVIGDSNSITGSIISNIAGKQAASSALSSIAGLTTAANQMIYTTAANTYSTTALGSTGKSIIAASSAAAVRTTIGAIDSTATVAAAVKDDANRVISSTYLTISTASSTYAAKTAAISSVTGDGTSTTINYTKADGTKGSFTTKDTVYTLPKATNSALGGVMVGSNISLDTATGKISLSSSNVTTALGYTPSSADTHYTTKLIVGTSTATGMTAATNGNVYLRLFDNSTARNSIKVTGSGRTTVTSDSAGTITVSTTAYANATQSADGLLSSADKKIIDGISTTYAAKTAAISSISGDGTSTRITYTKADGTTGSFITENTDMKVRMYLSTYNEDYMIPFRLGNMMESLPDGDYATESLQVVNGVTVNPSTKTITATNFNGTATKANQDGSGNVITSTYLTISTASSTYAAKTAAISSVTGDGTSTTITYTKADGTTGSFTTKDTIYSLPKATTSALGGVIVGSNISLDTATGKISLSSGNVTTALGYTPPTANTHYTTKLIAGASNSTANTATTNGNLYLRLFDDSTARNSIKMTGAGLTTVTSDSTGTITVSTTGYSNATQSAAGLLSAADKTIIDNISTNYVAKANVVTSVSLSGTTVTVTKGNGSTNTFTVATTNTDQSVKQESNAANAAYPVIFKASTATGSTTTSVYFNNKVTVNPSTGTLSATTIVGSLAASYITGTLGVDHGGTGLTSNPSMLTNLGSTTAANVFAASPRPGVTGTLPVANGGTGQTSIANIQAGKDSAGNTISTTYATKATAVTSVAITNGILSKTINGSTTYANVIIPYGSATETAIAKTVAIANFALATGSRITVKFTNNGAAGNCTLNVNGTGAKAIYYRGYQLPGDALLANTTLDLVYNGSQWEIIGSFFWTV